MCQKFDKLFTTNNLCMGSSPFVLKQYLSSPNLPERIQCTSLYIFVLLLC